MPLLLSCLEWKRCHQIRCCSVKWCMWIQGEMSGQMLLKFLHIHNMSLLLRPSLNLNPQHPGFHKVLLSVDCTWKTRVYFLFPQLQYCLVMNTLFQTSTHASLEILICHSLSHPFSLSIAGLMQNEAGKPSFQKKLILAVLDEVSRWK